MLHILLGIHMGVRHEARINEEGAAFTEALLLALAKDG
jgi:hypothetical protein